MEKVTRLKSRWSNLETIALGHIIHPGVNANQNGRRLVFRADWAPPPDGFRLQIPTQVTVTEMEQQIWCRTAA